MPFGKQPTSSRATCRTRSGRSRHTGRCSLSSRPGKTGKTGGSGRSFILPNPLTYLPHLPYPPNPSHSKSASARIAAGRVVLGGHNFFADGTDTVAKLEIRAL